MSWLVRDEILLAIGTFWHISQADWAVTLAKRQFCLANSHFHEDSIKESMTQSSDFAVSHVICMDEFRSSLCVHSLRLELEPALKCINWMEPRINIASLVQPAPNWSIQAVILEQQVGPLETTSLPSLVEAKYAKQTSLELQRDVSLARLIDQNDVTIFGPCNQTNAVIYYFSRAKHEFIYIHV